MQIIQANQVPGIAINSARDAASHGQEGCHRFLGDPANLQEVATALRIRAVENALYDLFGKGKLHGTIHTCIGQEFSGAILGKYLRESDFVTSNHRCHGHFIAATQNWRGLIDELVGNADGVCAGIGSSQHLWAKNFISNGQQGGLIPVAAGVALDRKLQGNGGVVVSYLGEGTLGEGVVYESFNLDSLWDLPHIVICENNFYSQSTMQDRGVSGLISERAKSFGVTSETADTWNLPHFDSVFAEAVTRARTDSRPTFIALKTYRLNPHSKGDDNRDKAEIEWFRGQDPATIAVKEYKQFGEMYDGFVAEANDCIELALTKPKLDPKRYFMDQLPRSAADEPVAWTPVAPGPLDDQRMVQQLNAFYFDWMESDKTSFFIGEDIEDPYGGAFKISKGFTTAFGPRARTTPISEAAIAGIGVGLAVAGRRAFVEIMFGDFITYAFDQILNNASKMYHMYNQNLSVPVIIRTPMGGRRGYGPTHSQSLERFLIGVDNCCTLSLNSMVNVAVQLSGLKKIEGPAVLLENKSDYTVKTFALPAGFVASSDGALFPTVRIHAENADSHVTIFSYGGMARFVADSLLTIFDRTDAVPEMIVPVCISPLEIKAVVESVQRTGHLLIVEEGSGFGSVGAEVIAQLSEIPGLTFTAARVSGKPVPIPSAPTLEVATLPSIDDVCVAIEELSARQ
jgi:2-oxoisovalerate dehydrogenase E1 component